MDMDASAEDFADNMSEYFMRAVLSDKVGEMFKTRLNNWYNDFASAMEDGTLSDNEIEALIVTTSNSLPQKKDMQQHLKTVLMN